MNTDKKDLKAVYGEFYLKISVHPCLHLHLQQAVSPRRAPGPNGVQVSVVNFDLRSWAVVLIVPAEEAQQLALNIAAFSPRFMLY